MRIALPRLERDDSECSQFTAQSSLASCCSSASASVRSATRQADKPSPEVPPSTPPAAASKSRRRAPRTSGRHPSAARPCPMVFHLPHPSAGANAPSGPVDVARAHEQAGLIVPVRDAAKKKQKSRRRGRGDAAEAPSVEQPQQPLAAAAAAGAAGEDAAAAAAAAAPLPPPSDAGLAAAVRNLVRRTPRDLAGRVALLGEVPALGFAAHLLAAVLDGDAGAPGRAARIAVAACWAAHTTDSVVHPAQLPLRLAIVAQTQRAFEAAVAAKSVPVNLVDFVACLHREGLLGSRSVVQGLTALFVCATAEPSQKGAFAPAFLILHTRTADTLIHRGVASAEELERMLAEFTAPSDETPAQQEAPPSC